MLEKLQDPTVIAALSAFAVAGTQLLKPFITENRSVILPLLSCLIYLVGGFVVVLAPENFVEVLGVFLTAPAVTGLYGASKDVLGSRSKIDLPV